MNPSGEVVSSCCLTPQEHEKKVKESLTSSVKDAAAFNAMQGGSANYILPFAIALSATPIQLSLLSSVPNLVSAWIHLFATDVMARLGSRRKAISWLVLLQALTFLPMVGIAVYFTGENAVWLLVLFYTLFLAFGSIISPIWQSLMGDLIPSATRGQFFAQRNMIGGFTALVMTLVAGYVLEIVPSNLDYLAFALIFSLGFLFRVISWHYVRQLHEPVYQSPPEAQFSFIQFVEHMSQTNFGHFVLYAGLFSFAVGIASPFFSVYMLRDLSFDYWTYSIIMIASMISSLMVVLYWGQIADRFGNRLILNVCGLVIAFIPLLYVFFPSPLSIFVFEFFVTGLFWAGFNLAIINFIFDSTKPEKRARCSAYFFVFNGMGAFLGTLAGGLFITYFPFHLIQVSFSPIQWVFILSFIFRLLIHLLFYRLVHEVRPVEPLKEEKLLVQLLVGSPFRGFAGESLHFVKERVKLNFSNVLIVEQNVVNVVKKVDQWFEQKVDRAVHDADSLLKKVERKK